MEKLILFVLILGVASGFYFPPCYEVYCPEYSPICATNGVTYSSPCELANKACNDTSIEPCYGGKCVSGKKCCRKYCYEIYSPLCGSDGRTYDNGCYMEKAACESGSRIYVDHPGECYGVVERSASAAISLHLPAVVVCLAAMLVI